MYLEITNHTFSRVQGKLLGEHWTCYLTVLSIVSKKIFRKIAGRTGSPILHWNYTRYILLNAISNSLFDAITFLSSPFFFFTRISDVQRPLCIQILGFKYRRWRRNRLFLIPRANINCSTRSTALQEYRNYLSNPRFIIIKKKSPLLSCAEKTTKNYSFQLVDKNVGDSTWKRRVIRYQSVYISQYTWNTLRIIRKIRSNSFDLELGPRID